MKTNDVPKCMTLIFADTDEVSFNVSGSGTATIDWGDGTPHETHVLSDKDSDCKHTYPEKSDRTIIITGENITDFSSRWYDYSLTSVDVSKNTALERLFCSKNWLTNLDVSKNIALTSLDCSENGLTELDVSANTALWRLDCGENHIESLDVSRNSALTTLCCQKNKLTDLDMSKNFALRELNCSNNQLTSLNVGNNSMLEILDCRYNYLTSLDVRDNAKLTEFDYSEQFMREEMILMSEHLRLIGKFRSGELNILDIIKKDGYHGMYKENREYSDVYKAYRASGMIEGVGIEYD